MSGERALHFASLARRIARDNHSATRHPRVLGGESGMRRRVDVRHQQVHRGVRQGSRRATEQTRGMTIARQVSPSDVQRLPVHVAADNIARAQQPRRAGENPRACTDIEDLIAWQQVSLERHLLPGDQVLDVGTGSGILAGASWLLGAGNVVGCDMDGEALDIGRRNLTCDGHSARLFRGSARSLAHAAVDLLVANINAAAHAALAAEYSRVARRAVIVSGYASREGREVERSLARHGLHAVDTLDAEDWMCLVLCKEEPSSPL